MKVYEIFEILNKDLVNLDKYKSTAIDPVDIKTGLMIGNNLYSFFLKKNRKNMNSATRRMLKSDCFKVGYLTLKYQKYCYLNNI